DGSIGQVTYVHLSDFGNFVTATQGILSTWWFQSAKGGGWFGAHGSHRVDQLRYLFGEITEVSATLATVINEPQRKRPLVSEVDDSYFLTLRFGSGALGICLDGAATSLPVRPERLEVYGTDGTLVIEGERLLSATEGGALEEIAVEHPSLPGLE